MLNLSWAGQQSFGLLTRLSNAVLGLFAAGEQGAWYDPQDYGTSGFNGIGTLYQDSAGTTLCSAVEQPVGLMLDKRKGLQASTKGGWLSGIAGSRFTSPDSVASSITGNIDIRVKLSMVDWTPAAASLMLTKFSSSNLSYYFFVQADGKLNFQTSPDGTATVAAVSTVATGVADGATKWVRATRQVNNGAAGNTTKFYLSDDGVSWTQLGSDVVNAGTTTIYDGTGQLNIGGDSSGAFWLAGKVYRAQIYNGIDGTLAVDFNPLLYSSGSTFTAATGEVWTINGTANITPDGNHAYQSTSAARPTLRARYNVITYSEDVTNAAWAKVATATTPTATTASFPAANDYIYQTLTAATYAAKSVTISVELSGSGTTTIGFYDNVSGFQVDTITLTATPTRYTATKTIGTGAVDVRLVPAGRATAGTATSVTVTKIDVRMSNLIGTGLPAYQRIAASTDYDTAGFPVYIQGNGSSQFMQTAAIDFSGTDKMTVWAAVRKLSDATQVYAELSASWSLNTGSFALYTDSTGTTLYASASRGAAAAAANQVSSVTTTYTAPITNVLSSSHDIAGDLTTLRINTVAATNATGDKGAGNFGSAYPLYLLSRGGSSLWFDGYFYGAIVRGATTSNSEIAMAEQYLQLKSLAY